MERIEDFQYNRNTKSYEKFLSKTTNSMIIVYPNGTIEKIPDWDNCCLKLDTDWLLANKEAMERESGQQIKLEE